MPLTSPFRRPLRREFVPVWLAMLALAVLALPVLALPVPRLAHAKPTTPPRRIIQVELTHTGGGTASVNTNASATTTFLLKNVSGNQMTINLVITACSGALVPNSCTRSPTTVTLPDQAQTSIGSGFSGGAIPGAGTLTLTAKNTGGTTLASASVTVTVASPIPNVSAAPHVGDRREVGLCIADCFESTFSYTDPAYVSLDVPRSVTLLYRSGRAYPQGTVTLDVTDPYAQATTFQLKLKDSTTGAYVTFANGSQSLYFTRNTAGATRMVAQFPATTIPTSARAYTAEVTMIWPSGTQGMASANVRIIVLNDQVSPFGAGVEVAGVQQLFTNQSGGVLVTDGSGSASFFAGNCVPATACTFASPAGDFSVLKTGGGQYTRRYPDSTIVTFSSTGQATSIADRFGTTTQFTWAYNAPFNMYAPTYVTDPTGQSIQLAYYGGTDPTYKPGSLYAIFTPGTNYSNFVVTPSGNLDRFTDADHVCCRVATYDSFHRLTKFTATTGDSTNYSYRYGATLASIDAPMIKVDSGPVSGRVTGLMRRPRLTLRNAADALLSGGAVTGGGSSAAPLPVPTDMRALVIGPRSDTTLLSLNRFGEPQKTYSPLTPSDSVEYDNVTGLVTRTISPTGMDVRFTWSAGKLTNVQNATMGTQDSTVYDPQYSLPRQTISTTSAGQWFTYDQTKIGWPLQYSRIGSASATPTTYYSDAFGRYTKVVDEAGHQTSTYYATTGLRNTDSVKAPNLQVTRLGRDGGGRVTSTTNPRLEVSRSALDILNRPTWVSGPIVNDTTRYQYDALSNVTAVTDANNHVYTYQRNALGWVTKQIDPNAQADSSAYDIAGNVVYSRSRTGRVVKLDYDLLNRVTTKIGSAEHDTITYTFDAGNRWVAARTVSRGVLVSLDTLVVDSLGRTIREATYRPNAGYWANTSGYQFDKPGRVLSGLYQGVNAVRWIDFRYDSLQRPSEIRLLSGNSLLGYDAEQLPFSVTFPSGLIESTNYTSSHLPDTRFYSLPAVGNVFARSYLTDSLGRLVRRGEGSGGHFQDFYYDAKGRLAYWYKKTATSSTNCNNTTAYGYDCSQTILSTDSVTGAAYDAVGNPTELGGTADPGDRLLSYKSISMTYDLDGNMLSKGNDTYDWDDFGQLKGVTRLGATLATFDYDGFGRRIRKTSTSGGTVLYVWDGEQLSAEADAAGNLTQTYTYYPGMDRPHSVTTAAGVTYYTAVEPFGQIEGLIRGSDNAIVAQYSYNPWGELGANQDTVGGIRLNSLRWRGLVYDAETGLYQIRARYYDPKIRRFISEDPTGLGGGINQYTFALNDPVNNSDPSGREACRIEQGAEWSYTDEYGTHVVAEPNKIVCDVGGAFDWFRSVGEVLKLTFDFATGRGDNTRYYGPGSPQVNDMKNAPGVAKARADACQQVRDGSQPNVDDWHDFPKMEIIYAGLNPTRQFLGSHGTKVTALPNGHMQFTVYNTTSAHSALFHLDSVHNWGRDWYGVKHIPGGNMDQILSWTESNASCFQ